MHRFASCKAGAHTVLLAVVRFLHVTSAGTRARVRACTAVCRRLGIKSETYKAVDSQGKLRPLLPEVFWTGLALGLHNDYHHRPTMEWTLKWLDDVLLDTVYPGTTHTSRAQSLVVNDLWIPLPT